MPPFPFPTRAQLLQSSVRTIQYLAAAHLLWEYGYNVRFTRGPSMLPTLEVADDCVLVSNLHRYGRGVTVGDLVAFKIPFNQDDAIKRVIGLPGDYVMTDTPESGSETMIQVRMRQTATERLSSWADFFRFRSPLGTVGLWVTTCQIPETRGILARSPLLSSKAKSLPRHGRWGSFGGLKIHCTLQTTAEMGCRAHTPRFGTHH